MADVALGTRAGQEPRPSNGGTAGRPVATAGDALDRSDLSRMRAFHLFGVFAPLVAIVVSLLLDGDPRARIAFWCGIGLLSLCNIVLVYLTTRPALYRPRPVGILWVVSTLGILPGIVYFGPFSAVVMVPMLGIVFIAIGRVQWTARATAAICIGGHVVIALPIILGWWHDIGILTSQYTRQGQLWSAEVLVVGFLTSGYALGRWA